MVEDICGSDEGMEYVQPWGGEGKAKSGVGMPPHPLPGQSLASLPIRTWSPQMAVSPSPWTPCSRTQPYHGCRDHIRPLAILRPFPSALTRKVQLKCAWGSTAGHLLSWTLYLGPW